MTKNPLAHEESPIYAAAHQVYDSALAIANTERRIINRRLEAHAFRLLTHAATAAAEKAAPARARRVQYAVLAIARLGATLDAAWSGHCISADQYTRVRREMLVLNEALQQTTSSGATPTTISETAETAEAAEITETAESRSAGVQISRLSVEELIELRQLAERDSRLVDRSASAAGSGPGS